jgi:hypothetical protein
MEAGLNPSVSETVSATVSRDVEVYNMQIMKHFIHLCMI